MYCLICRICHRFEFDHSIYDSMCKGFESNDQNMHILPKSLIENNERMRAVDDKVPDISGLYKTERPFNAG